MAERDVKQRGGWRAPVRIVSVSCAVACLLIVGAFLTATLYIRTPAAAHEASRLLTGYLGYPVAVAGLSLTGGTLTVNALTIGNPAGFSGEAFASCRSIAIAPDWLGFLRGKKDFATIALSEGRVSIRRNERGEWNVRELLRRLSKKRGGGETLIRRLSISDASVAVEQTRLDNLTLTVRDLATKGSTGSRFILTWKDAGGSPFRLEGGARLGADPAIDAVLSAPSFALRTIAESFGHAVGPPLANATGALDIALNVHGGSAAVRGKLGVAGIAPAVRDVRVPLRGDLDFAARYDVSRDEAFLDACTARLNGIIRLHASGTVRQVRTQRAFVAKVAGDSIDLAALTAMLPPALRHDLTAGGTLTASAFRFAGDARHGLVEGSGDISLRGGEVSRGERLLAGGLDADASLEKGKDGWQLRGRIARQEGGGEGVLEQLSVPFAVAFSSSLTPVRAELPAVTATLFGIPAEGKLSYRAGSPAPLSFRLDMRNVPVSRLSRALPGKGVSLSAGRATVSLQGGGAPRELQGKVTAECADLRGSTTGTPFMLKSGATGAGFSISGGKLAVAGSVRWGGGRVGERQLDGACSYGVRDGEFYLADGTFRLDRLELLVARVSGPLPLPAHAERGARIPLHAAFSGVTVRTPLAGLDDMSGRLAADYVSAQGRRWLEGSGTVANANLSWKGKAVGALEGGLRFTAAGAAADVRGTLLDGRLGGTASIDPFDRERTVGFSLVLEKARCESLAAFTSVTTPVRAAKGIFGLRLTGGYGRTDGLRCRLEGDASGIALAGAGGRTLLENGGLRTVCEMAGGTLLVKEGIVTAGNAITLKGGGKVARVLSPEREGDISLALVTTPLDAFLTAWVNVLPRGLQEASAVGSVAADGTLRMAHGQTLFDGAVHLHQGGLEIASQKFSVEGMTGSIPVSLALTGTAGAGKPERRRFNREAYPALLALLRRAATSGQTFTIGRVRMGGIEFGTTSLAVRAGKGLMEITSLESSLFDGALLGEGFFRYGKKPEYGADLTINGLSLRELCDANPKIKGYISGKVDGVVSLYGEGAGMSGLRGFTEIWTRSAPGEKMQVSKEFLQKMAGRKFKGLFFRDDRPYDRGEIRGYLENGYLTFDTLDISHTNFFGIRDLSVTVAPVQNRISLVHLYASIREAATRGKATSGAESPPPSSQPETDFKWEE